MKKSSLESKKFKIFSFMVLILFVVFANISVYASDDSFDLHLNEDTNLVAPGNTLNLDMVISNINVSEGEKGISGFTADLSFDENIFEYEKITSKSENWNVSYESKHIIAYREKTDVLTNSSSEVIESGILGTITLKVKNEAKAGTTKVKLEKVEGGDALHSFPGNTNEIDIKIAEKASELSSIEIASEPSKTTYKEGEKFDSTGLTVLAKYDNNTSVLVTDYTYTPNDELARNDTKITISYTENGVTKEATIDITVKAKEENDIVDGEGNNTTRLSADLESKTNTDVSINSNLTKVTSTNGDNSTANKVLPKTGKLGIVAIVIAISMILVLYIVKYMKYKDV